MLLRLPTCKIFYRSVGISTSICIIGLPMLCLLGQEKKPQVGATPKEALAPEMYARVSGRVDQLTVLEKQLVAFGMQHRMIQVELARQTEQINAMGVINATLTQKLIDMEKRLDIHRSEIDTMSPVQNNERLARIEAFIVEHDKEQQAEVSWVKLVFGTLLGGVVTVALNERFKRRRNNRRWVQRDRIEEEHTQSIKDKVAEISQIREHREHGDVERSHTEDE